MLVNPLFVWYFQKKHCTLLYHSCNTHRRLVFLFYHRYPQGSYQLGDQQQYEGARTVQVWGVGEVSFPKLTLIGQRVPGRLLPIFSHCFKSLGWTSLKIFSFSRELPSAFETPTGTFDFLRPAIKYTEIFSSLMWGEFQVQLIYQLLCAAWKKNDVMTSRIRIFIVV